MRGRCDRGGPRALVALSALLFTAGCDAILAEEEPSRPVANQAATVAPMPSPSEIVVPAPPLPPEQPSTSEPEAALPPPAGVDGGPAAPAPVLEPGGNLDNPSIKRALYGKMLAGKATIDEIRMLKAACGQMGDKACRDQASAALKNKLGD